MPNGLIHRSRLYLTPYHLLLLSTIIYFSPYLVGSFEYLSPYGGRLQYFYSNEVGPVAFFIIALLAALAFGVPREAIFIAEKHQQKYESGVILTSLLVLFVYVIIDGNIFVLNKSEMLEGTNRAHLAFYQVSSIAFIYATLAGYKKNRWLTGMAIISLMLIMYAGHRSALLVAILGASYIYFRANPMTKKVLATAIIAPLIFLLLSLYKSIYAAVKSGSWDLVAFRLSSENLLTSLTVGMEQFVTFAHLDFLVSSGYSLDCSNAWLIPMTVIPFMDDILANYANIAQCDYNAQVQPVFFSAYSGGVAANIWAEAYGHLGILGIPILITVLSMFFSIIESIIKKVNSPLMVSGLIVGLINMSFYIQRKEILSAFISAKRAVYIALILFIIVWAMQRLESRR